MNALRLPLALLGALAFSATMFWALWSLVSDTLDVTDFQDATRIDFTRMRRDTETVTKREEKVEREQPPVAPEVPRMNFTAGGFDNNVASLTPVVDARGAMSKLSMSAGSDRDVIPLVRINPDYPPRALSRNITGWVQVQFTITASGTVKDAKVVDAQPKNMFDDAALKAIARWRYNPKVDNGIAVERVGMQTVIRFELEEG